MIRFEPIESLELYISSMTLDFSKVIHYGICAETEEERKKKTRLGILAVLKLYKNIPLDTEELELLEEFPLRENDKEIERRVQFITFKIGQQAREAANNMRNRLDSVIFILGRGINPDTNVINYLMKVRDNYAEYVEYLDEYNKSFTHAYVFKHNAGVTNLDRIHIEPTIDFNCDLFLPKKIVERARQ